MLKHGFLYWSLLLLIVPCLQGNLNDDSSHDLTDRTGDSTVAPSSSHGTNLEMDIVTTFSIYDHDSPGINQENENSIPAPQLTESLLLSIPTNQADVSSLDVHHTIVEDVYIVDNTSKISNETVIKETQDVREEDIETFSEWTKQRLAEAEQKERYVNGNITINNVAPTKTQSIHKIRAKNYASPDCGAKVLIANPEAQNPWAVLSPSRDEYLLNICKAKLWFVVELCEAVKAEKVDVANFELFSSSPKEFVVSLSDRYPTRDWTVVGKFIASDERSIQRFALNQHQFGKFIKVEILSHYESEHFCPLSLFHVYGTSEYEVLETLGSSTSGGGLDSITEDEELEGAADSHPDLFGSAKEAVMSIVKKAANVFRAPEKESVDEYLKDKVFDGPCSTLAYPHFVSPSIPTLSSPYANEINELLSCHGTKLFQEVRRSEKLLSILVNTPLCKYYQTIWMLTNLSSPSNSCQVDSISLFFITVYGAPYIGALCVLKCNILQLSTNSAGYTISPTHISTNIPENKNTEETTATVVGSSTVQISVSSTEASISESIILSELPTISTADMIQPSKTISNVETVDGYNIASSMGNFSTQKDVTNQTPLHSTSVTITDTQFILVEDTTENSDKSDADSNIATDIYIDENLPHFNDFSSNSSWENDTSQHTVAPNIPKETVFLRLSNKIKALELNLSLSSQYLEQLSRSYKELKRSFNYTIGRIDDIDNNQTRLLTQLSIALANLTVFINNLSTNQDDLKGWVIQTHVLLMFLEIILLFILFGFCIKSSRGGLTLGYPEFSDKIQYVDINKHASEDANWGTSGSKSDDDVTITKPELYLHGDEIGKKKKSKKKRKSSGLTRSKSNGALFEPQALKDLCDYQSKDLGISLPSTGVLFGSTDALKSDSTKCIDTSTSSCSAVRNIHPQRSVRGCDKEGSTPYKDQENIHSNGNIASMNAVTNLNLGPEKNKRKKLPSFKRMRKSSSDLVSVKLQSVTFEDSVQEKLSPGRRKKSLWDFFRKSK